MKTALNVGGTGPGLFLAFNDPADPTGGLSLMKVSPNGHLESAPLRFNSPEDIGALCSLLGFDVSVQADDGSVLIRRP